MSERLSFFIVGVQKAGTTALHAMLSAHPALCLSTPKELHFFDDEARDWTRPDYAALHAPFAGRAGLRGEATPITIFWPAALARLHAYNPAAKLILCLRHPAFRAYAHWRMARAAGMESLGFEGALARPPEARQGDVAARWFSYLERGFYDRQIERLLGLFPRRQLLILRTEEMWREPVQTLRRIEGFLGVPPATVPPPGYVAPFASAAAPVPPIAAQTLARLAALYAASIRAAARLTGENLETWLDPAFAEPMAPPVRHLLAASPV